MASLRACYVSIKGKEVGGRLADTGDSQHAGCREGMVGLGTSKELGMTGVW